MSALPIRVRLTLVFVALLAVIFAAVGLGVYLHTKQSLDEVIRGELISRAADVASLSRSHSLPIAPRERVAQILSPLGEVEAGRPGQSALSAAERRHASRRAFFVDRTEATRLYARPGPGGTVVVVGVSLHQREHALESLATALSVGGPVALLLASLLAYSLTGAALKPINEMRRLAGEATDPSARLPLPEANDEVRRLAETLNGMLGRVEAAVQHEQAFVANASHELRTPLALLRGELELASASGATAADLRRAIDTAIADTDRLSRIVSDLLLLARAHEGALEPQFEELQAESVILSVGERYGVAVGELQDRDAAFRGDRQLVEQALGNLVENATIHGAGTVRLSVSRAGQMVELHVTDDGPGFSADFLPRAFDRFSREGSGHEGAGLGLALARALVELQGGQVGVANHPDGGADARIQLPTSIRPSS